MSWLCSCAFLAAISLGGFGGEVDRARAFFDVNNAKVGDPLVLSVDFIGRADFSSLHPPALAAAVDRGVWRVDDASAKTDTFPAGRRLVYRVRPLKEGVLYFPSLEFSYTTAGGERRMVRTNLIPVHAKPGEGVVVEGMSEREANELPRPDAYLAAPGVELNEDEYFYWRKALAAPSPDAFARFDFPNGRLNEATAALNAGDWKRALSIYSRLEWRTGQTPAIERGIIVAQALRYDNAAAELPVWREVGRPLLKYGWKGRSVMVLGGLLGIALVYFLLGRVLKLLAALAILLTLVAPLSGRAQGIFDPFEEMERMQQEMMQRMNQMTSGMTISFGGGGINEEAPPQVTAKLELDRESLTVGEEFALLLALEVPKKSTFDDLRMVPSQWFGLTSTGENTVLADTASENPSNVVKHLRLPVRYDVPFTGELSILVTGRVTTRMQRGSAGGSYSFNFSTSFRAETQALKLDVKPLPSAGQPADFSGIIAERVAFLEQPDLASVESNDVITITYAIKHNGYLPKTWMPEGAAFEWARRVLPQGKGASNWASEAVEWKRYFVADGAKATPKFSICYYNPKTKKYQRINAGGSVVKYK